MTKYDEGRVKEWLNWVGWGDDSPDDVATADRALTALCVLQSAVRRALSSAGGSQGPADCFCDAGLYAGTDEYQNDGEAIAFIVDATLRRIDKKLRPKAER